MFRRFKDSPYAKAAITILISGGLLILFKNWVDNTQFSIGFQTFGKTMAPIITGIVCAFILCPIYNGSVKRIYNWQLRIAKRGGVSFGQDVKPAGTSEEFIVYAADKRKMFGFARGVASLFCVIIVVGLVAMLFYFIVPQVIQNGVSLVNTLPERLDTLSNWINTHFSRFPFVTKWIDNVLNTGTSDILAWVQEHILNTNAMTTLATTISNGLYVAVKYVVNAFIGLLIMVYLLNYKEKLFASSRKVIAATCGQKRQAALFEFAEVVNETFIGFIVGRLIDSFIIGVLTFLVMTVCNIQFALMISVIVGVTNVIPFFGPFIGAVPSVFILMLEDPMQALYFIIIVLVIQQLDGNIIGPKIVGNAIGISSFGVLIAVLVGGGLFGFAGMALGVPVFAVCVRYFEKLTNRGLRNKEKSTATQDYFNLEPYGIDDEDVMAEPEKKKSSLFSKNKNKKNKNANAEDVTSSDDEDDEFDAEADKAELRAYLEKEREESADIIKKPISNRKK